MAKLRQQRKNPSKSKADVPLDRATEMPRMARGVRCGTIRNS
jgi:hypothetical protein